ncbi:MAG TPA: formyltetrahydrofolate deformylase [Microthrixaceae bacterium]|nr:formyltetrahydrofolate deformylase [Microthrixaceae bacterium]
MAPTAVLLLSCRDRPGIVATVADFVWRHGGNIVDAEQHTDRDDGMFFQRVEFELEGFAVGRDGIREAFDPVAAEFDMEVTVGFSDERPRTAVLASRAPHCLVDVLSRWHSGELRADLALVASNHPDHEDLARFYGLPYHHLPVGDDPAAQDRAMRELLAAHDVQLVVLARYMRILSPAFVRAWPNRIINIHHSFLPAFAGAQPYRQAHERGVKIIGATAHYVTEVLDEGPIIAQDVAHVTHRDDVEDLTSKGRDLEVVVLARALKAHLAHRVLVWGNRTVVFS